MCRGRCNAYRAEDFRDSNKCAGSRPRPRPSIASGSGMEIRPPHIAGRRPTCKSPLMSRARQLLPLQTHLRSHHQDGQHHRILPPLLLSRLPGKRQQPPARRHNPSSPHTPLLHRMQRQHRQSACHCNLSLTRTHHQRRGLMKSRLHTKRLWLCAGIGSERSSRSC